MRGTPPPDGPSKGNDLSCYIWIKGPSKLYLHLWSYTPDNSQINPIESWANATTAVRPTVFLSKPDPTIDQGIDMSSQNTMPQSLADVLFGRTDIVTGHLGISPYAFETTQYFGVSHNAINREIKCNL